MLVARSRRARRPTVAIGVAVLLAAASSPVTAAGPVTAGDPRQAGGPWVVRPPFAVEQTPPTGDCDYGGGSHEEEQNRPRLRGSFDGLADPYTGQLQVGAEIVSAHAPVAGRVPPADHGSRMECSGGAAFGALTVPHHPTSGDTLRLRVRLHVDQVAVASTGPDDAARQPLFFLDVQVPDPAQLLDSQDPFGGWTTPLPPVGPFTLELPLRRRDGSRWPNGAVQLLIRARSNVEVVEPTFNTEALHNQVFVASRVLEIISG